MFKRTDNGERTTIVVCLPLGMKGIFISGKYGKSISIQKWREVGDNFVVLKMVKLEEVFTNIFRFSKSVTLLEKGVDFV